MAKKAANDFNMAEEIREHLTKNPSATGREVEESLRKKFPKQKINRNSCGVAFSNARKKLGLRKPTGFRSFTGTPVDVNILRAAKNYLAQCGGDENRALSGLKQLADLQV